jgi:hypothetical protein
VIRITVRLPGTKDLGVGDVRVNENGNEIVHANRGGVIVKSLAVANGQYQSVALVIDNSKAASAADLKQLEGAAQAFIAAVPSTVPFGVVTLASKPQVLQKVEFHDQPAARRALDSVRPASTDPDLSDAIVAAAGTFPIRGQHNIVVLSTGPGSSGALSGAAAKAVQKAGALVSTITLGGQAGSDLASLADRTGGTTTSASAGDLPAATDALAHRIGDQFLLTYPSLAHPGDHLDIKITILGKTIQTSATVPASAPGISPTPSPALFSGTRGYILIIAIIVALLVLSSIPGRVRSRRRRGGGAGRERGPRMRRRDGGRGRGRGRDRAGRR